ncbi:MAG: threonylcarbamoyl-AMP synthase [Saprospiraceae bacterium]|nr:threonylcarbamoyl-AMP synthase [Saprospiraceae bacterium]
MGEFYENEIMELAEVMRSGGVVLIPTDSVWGIACDATNVDAVNRIFAIKNRTKDKPFVLLASDIVMVKSFVDNIHPKIETLLLYHKRPLTVVYDNAKGLPLASVASDNSVAIRIPFDDYCNALITKLGKPIVATSANFSGQPFPGRFSQIDLDLIKLVDRVAHYRRNEQINTEPSVIVRLNDDEELDFIRS